MRKHQGIGKNILIKDEEPETQILPVVKATAPLEDRERKTEDIPEIRYERKPEDIVSTDEMVRLTVVSLLRGKAFAADRFPVHSGFISLLCRDLAQGREVLFLEHLHQYFTQARRHITQMPSVELADRILTQVRQYIKQYGLSLVGKIILARMAA